MNLTNQIEIAKNRLKMAILEGNITEKNVWESILDTLQKYNSKENKNDF